MDDRGGASADISNERPCLADRATDHPSALFRSIPTTPCCPDTVPSFPDIVAKQALAIYSSPLSGFEKERRGEYIFMPSLGARFPQIGNMVGPLMYAETES